MKLFYLNLCWCLFFASLGQAMENNLLKKGGTQSLTYQSPSPLYMAQEDDEESEEDKARRECSYYTAGTTATCCTGGIWVSSIWWLGAATKLGSACTLSSVTGGILAPFLCFGGMYGTMQYCLSESEESD